jgi:hypothetical protein
MSLTGYEQTTFIKQWLLFLHFFLFFLFRTLYQSGFYDIAVNYRYGDLIERWSKIIQNGCPGEQLLFEALCIRIKSQM